MVHFIADTGGIPLGSVKGDAPDKPSGGIWEDKLKNAKKREAGKKIAGTKRTAAKKVQKPCLNMFQTVSGEFWPGTKIISASP